MEHNNALEPVVKLTDEEYGKYAAFTNVRLNLAVAKHNFQAGMFTFPKNPELDDLPSPNKEEGRRSSIRGGVIKIATGLRRLYLQAYDQNRTTFAPPDCASVDGVEGSVERTTNITISRMEVDIFGNCDTCYYSKFRSKMAFDPKATSIAPLCSEYALAFILMNMQADGSGGIPIVLQIPPTGLAVLQTMHQSAAMRNSPPDVFIWEFLGAGGKVGTKRSAMSVSLAQPLQQAGWETLKRAKVELQATMERYVERFGGGEALENADSADTSASESRID